MIKKEFLAKKHTGLRISAAGVLNRITGFLGFGCKELLKHLEELSERFYDGDIKAVDELLQLYCLDDKRPDVESQEDK